MGYRDRDSRRKKLYEAERDAFDSFYKPDLPDIKDCREFVDKITRSRWWKARAEIGIANVTVRDGRGHQNATGSYRLARITLPRWSRSKYIILHELSHVLAPYIYGTRIAAHGREYAKVYLQMVRRWLGKEEADKLKAAFKKHNVRFTGGRKEPLHRPTIAKVNKYGLINATLGYTK